MIYIIISILFQLSDEQTLTFNVCENKNNEFLLIENEKKEIQMVGYCYEGKKQGTWHEWDSEDKLQINFYQNGEKTDKQAKKISDIDHLPCVGESDGEIKTFYPDRMTKEIYCCKNQKIVNSFIAFYNNGQKKSEVELNVDGKVDGKSIRWNKDGIKTRESYYKNGKLHGVVTEWTKLGQKISEETYFQGYLEGSSVFYNIRGEIRERCEFKQNERIKCDIGGEDYDLK